MTRTQELRVRALEIAMQRDHYYVSTGVNSSIVIRTIKEVLEEAVEIFKFLALNDQDVF